MLASCSRAVESRICMSATERGLPEEKAGVLYPVAEGGMAADAVELVSRVGPELFAKST